MLRPAGGERAIGSVAAGVVGTGTAASCTDAALNTALIGGGLVVFHCGDAATIDISAGTGTKVIDIDTTIDGGGSITISGGHRVRVFFVKPGVKFTAQHLTIADGEGAIVNPEGSLTIVGCTFSGNSGAFGGIAGGAIYDSSGTLTVTDSSFVGNRAHTIGGQGGVGGAIWSAGATVANSTFTNNTADFEAGAIMNRTVALIIANSTFAGNTATTYGGAIFNAGAMTITNSTFMSNGAAGIVSVGDRTVLFRNTIVANTDCVGSIITDGGHNLDDGTSCGFSPANGSLNNTDPEFDPVGVGRNGGPTQTLALCTAVGVPAGCIAASPAVDAADETACAAPPVNGRDQRGFVRLAIGHTHCSIGAYEADATPPEVCIGDCTGTQAVAVNDIIRLVNIVLGLAQPSVCPYGVPSGTDVSVVVIIEAVNNALNGCGIG